MDPLAADMFKEDEEAIADSEEDIEDDEEEMYEHAEDTRLRYERLQARGRAMELAYQRRLEREREQAHAAAAVGANDTRRERSRSHSKSRSRPATPITALFKRDAFVLGITRSQSPPVNNAAVVDKSSRRSSISNLFKFKPISRSSSSKSISNGSSVPTSPFPSPLTPISPLPAFLSPKLRRKPMPASSEDTEPAFGSPLTRAKRRPSPIRAQTLPDELYPLEESMDRTPIPLRPTPIIAPHRPHLVYAADQNSPLKLQLDPGQ
ncbi:SubName: Full=Uncharacterized protein {ECO:0000313/EMBL:CCA72480.1} [Serendipita indica DSM 11827]|uniref:Uncharacterized protein n=1 Tax=Serendipita indica (strain DSM 11827) TaxID=1109443 RepID=G4TMD7_SERID|nr:SubName: Full=Uncharacterized protein {ECO:0000313/EMBL:CCA72480.1} [Serendipita indica DSM 11827]CCA72480.1 hypothetical protein PIIN_06415 [Serendipita indica DSM 11827]